MLSRGPIVLLIVLMATNLDAAEPPKQDAVKKALNEIQGTWKLTALEVDGMQAPEAIVAVLKLVFKDDTLTFTPGEPGFTKYKFKLDPTTKPASFDMTHTEEYKEKGKIQKGIYRLEGDRLKICFSQTGKRPKLLTAKAKSKQLMYALQRENPGAKRETDEQR